MPTKSFNPITKSRRYITVLDYSELTRTTPQKSLTKGKKSTGGRNSAGRITTRFRGNGNKRRYRMIDFKRTKDGVPAVVQQIEYDPNRSAFIALLAYADGEKSYILAPEGLTVGQTVVSGEQAEIKPGNAMALRNIPVGLEIHCIEFVPGKRPHVRGLAMNPVDHPMGGGEGRTSGGGHPVSPWGQLAKGKKTRCPRKNSKRFIVERRKK